MREQRDIGVLEQSRAHQECLARHLLFGDARPQQQRTIDLVALHELLHHDRGHDVHGLPRVVSFTMTGAARHHRVLVAHARLVTGLRNAVHIGAERNLRLARAVAPLGRPRRRDARHALLDAETFLGQQGRDVALRLEFLEAEFLE